MRVFVTGCGAATPFGLGVASLYEGMLAGEHRIGPLKPPRDSLRPGYGAMVTMGPKEIRSLPNSRDMRPGTMTRYTLLSTLALGNAMADGEVPWDDGDGAQRRGLFVASYTNSDRFDKYVRFAHHVIDTAADGSPVINDGRVPQAIRKFSGFEFLKLMNNMPAAHGGIQGRCQGPCNTFLGTPSGGLQAVGRAFEAIRDGLAETMYAGGVGSSVHEHMMMTRATRKLEASSEVAPGEAGRPFDSGATGIVPGEGGGFLVLESESSARARAASVKAELVGYGEWFLPPATRDGLAETPAATVWASRKALAMAGLEAADIDLVTTHGESRPDLDALEARGLAEILGPRASSVPMLSLAAHIGSTEAGVGPICAGVAAASMAAGKAPGALNRSAPIPEYKGPTDASPMDGDFRHALVTVTTREGVSTAIVLRRVEG